MAEHMRVCVCVCVCVSSIAISDYVWMAWWWSNDWN